MTRQLLLAVVWLATPALAQTLSFGLFGDTPYNHWERQHLPDLLAEMGRENLAFVIHDGDIKSGSSECSDSALKDILGVFQQSVHPLIFVPGDNDWTDCHRRSNGGYDPLERLSRLRELFFADEWSLGRQRLKLSRQSIDPAFSEYRENVRWEAGGVLFVGINLPGSNNNYFGDGSKPEPSAEFVARSKANAAWLGQAFALAKSKHLRGLLITIQANPDFEATNSGTPKTGYGPFIDQLRRETMAFGGEVVLVHGDTHRMRIDHPLLDPDSGKSVTNFTRVETFGSPWMGWVTGTIDPDNPVLFHFVSRRFMALPQRID